MAGCWGSLRPGICAKGEAVETRTSFLALVRTVRSQWTMGNCPLRRVGSVAGIFVLRWLVQVVVSECYVVRVVGVSKRGELLGCCARAAMLLLGEASSRASWAVRIHPPWLVGILLVFAGLPGISRDRG